MPDKIIEAAVRGRRTRDHFCWGVEKRKLKKYILYRRYLRYALNAQFEFMRKTKDWTLEREGSMSKSRSMGPGVGGSTGSV